ncbi:hypothetical protein CKA38_08245 [Ereboglobus luteus]|uniref:Uncharacterized protein n=1 Tax=Ereboglobus luteus TaxID=1796921 RepID=A0A2U8E2X5_9BACT|nr:hypothetical protein CKA38_08245 [Ereboglobus luteus]
MRGGADAELRAKGRAGAVAVKCHMRDGLRFDEFAADEDRAGAFLRGEKIARHLAHALEREKLRAVVGPRGGKPGGRVGALACDGGDVGEADFPAAHERLLARGGDGDPKHLVGRRGFVVGKVRAADDEHGRHHSDESKRKQDFQKRKRIMPPAPVARKTPDAHSQFPRRAGAEGMIVRGRPHQD